jgi:hypothetical protein
MSEAIDLVTVDYEENGLTLVKELDKEVLSKGAWATVIYRYQDWNRTKECYGPDKYSIRRYQKSGDDYKPRSKFNISSKKQALQLVEILQKWVVIEDIEAIADESSD